jgi:uncharacterized protein YuzE
MDTKHRKKSEIKTIKYDKESDILYISCGKPRPGIAFEVSAGDLVRIDPYTDEIVGITILDFRERYNPPSSGNIEKFALGVYPQIIEAMGRSRSDCEC